jgi:isoamylase
MTATSTRQVWPGSAARLGAHWDGEGTNFAVFSAPATTVWLCLFDDAGSEERVQLPEVDSFTWHGYLPGVGPGQRYAYRVEGPWQPEQGIRCNPCKLLLDPYALAISGTVIWSDDNAENERLYDRRWTDNSRSDLDSAPALPRCVVVDEDFNWKDDAPPRTAWADTVIYETHVRGLTKLRKDLAATNEQGTYAGLASPQIRAYLKSLGVSAIELMPVHQFVTDDYLHSIGKRNYWGYDSIAYLAPHNEYSASGDLGQQVTEFKQMVYDLHQDGFEVLLDVVYNHTAEGGAGPGGKAGPTFGLRGLDNASYYLLDPSDPQTYINDTGTGNTINIWDPATLRLILDSLRYWVTDMHVDGFRFDLLAVLAQTDATHSVSAFLDIVSQDPVLAEVKLIAEPWAGYGVPLWSLGRLPSQWGQWNSAFRDANRQFWKSTASVGDLRDRVLGSPDIFVARVGERPSASVNYAASHDSLTLRDLVSYTRSNQLSWACDGDGLSSDPSVIALRAQQARNLLATAILSQGTPMMLHGDECGRTQDGEENAYDIDSPQTWLHWDAQDADMIAFTERTIALRAGQPVFRRRRFFQDGAAGAEWFVPAGAPATDTTWADPSARSITLFLDGAAIPYPDPRGQPVIGDSAVMLFNANWTEVEFTIPTSLAGEWTPALATEKLSGDPRMPPVKAGSTVTRPGRTLLVLTRPHA